MEMGLPMMLWRMRCPFNNSGDFGNLVRGFSRIVYVIIHLNQMRILMMTYSILMVTELGLFLTAMELVLTMSSTIKRLQFLPA